MQASKKDPVTNSISRIDSIQLYLYSICRKQDGLRTLSTRAADRTRGAGVLRKSSSVEEKQVFE